MRKHAILLASVFTFVGVYHKCTAQESPDLIEQDLWRVVDSLVRFQQELGPFMAPAPGVEVEFANQFGAFRINHCLHMGHESVMNARFFALISPDRRATETAICDGLAYNIGSMKMAEWGVRTEMMQVTDSTIIHIGTRARTILMSLVERLRTFDWGPCGPTIENRLQLAESAIEETVTEWDSVSLPPVKPR